MWRRSSSFIMNKCPLQVQNPLKWPKKNLNTLINNNCNGCGIYFYCRTRSEQHVVVTAEWLAQALAAADAVNSAITEAFTAVAASDPFAASSNNTLINSSNYAPSVNAFNSPTAAASTSTAYAAFVSTTDVITDSSASAPRPAKPAGEIKKFDVIEEYNYWGKEHDFAKTVAAIMALAAVIRESEATTMMELVIELRNAYDVLKSSDTSSISLSIGCDLFVRHVARTSVLDYIDFNVVKLRLIESCKEFGEISLKARAKIAMLSQDFITEGCTILVHGYSRVVLEVLKTAAAKKKIFQVLCTDGIPDRSGSRFSNELAKLGIPMKPVIDSAVYYTMDEVNMILVGANGIAKSGGIINVMGTCQIAVLAQSMNKPVYVAAESYKFSRLYPLDQKDIEPARNEINFDVPIPVGVEGEKSGRDYTPPKYLNLFFTDLGILSPSAVSDEIIRPVSDAYTDVTNE